VAIAEIVQYVSRIALSLLHDVGDFQQVPIGITHIERANRTCRSSLAHGTFHKRDDEGNKIETDVYSLHRMSSLLHEEVVLDGEKEQWHAKPASCATRCIHRIKWLQAALRKRGNVTMK